MDVDRVSLIEAGSVHSTADGFASFVEPAVGPGREETPVQAALPVSPTALESTSPSALIDISQNRPSDLAPATNRHVVHLSQLVLCV
jgi:hypothetical protein